MFCESILSQKNMMKWYFEIDASITEILDKKYNGKLKLVYSYLYLVTGYKIFRKHSLVKPAEIIPRYFSD